MNSEKITKSDIIRLVYSLAVIGLLALIGLHIAITWYPPPCGERVVQWAGSSEERDREWQCGPYQHLDTMKGNDERSSQSWAVCRCNK